VCKFGFIVLSYAAGTHEGAENHHRNGLSEERKDERLQSIFRCCGGWCVGHYASFCRRGVGKKSACSDPDVTASPAAPRSAGAPAEQLSRRGFKGLQSGIVPLPLKRSDGPYRSEDLSGFFDCRPSPSLLFTIIVTITPAAATGGRGHVGNGVALSFMSMALRLGEQLVHWHLERLLVSG
jgi:hypothetical protein